MTVVTFTMRVDGAEHFTETAPVVPFTSVEKMSKRFTVNEVEVEVEFEFDPPLLVQEGHADPA